MIKKNTMAKRLTTKKKPMTLEDFAAAIHTDLLRMATKDDIREIRKDMVTKADLWPMQRDIKTLDKNVRELRSDVTMGTESMVSKADLANTLGEELAKSAYSRRIDALDARVNALEIKAGIKPTHRAA
jgi:hypothetical protein